MAGIANARISCFLPYAEGAALECRIVDNWTLQMFVLLNELGGLPSHWSKSHCKYHLCIFCGRQPHVHVGGYVLTVLPH